MEIPVNQPKAEGRSATDAWLRALERTAPIARNAHFTFPLLIDHLAERFDTAPALLDDNECLSYRALAERANRYARWALDHGLGSGDIVCLLAPNCADYMAIWLGITRVGAVVALVNCNLAGQSLAHAINVVSPRHVIVGTAFGDAFAAALPWMISGFQCWAHNGAVLDFPRIDLEVQRHSSAKIDGSECRAPVLASRALLIYTSGTTGLPKAANVSHYRVMQWSHWFAGMMDTRPSDRMYNCLPMYHSIGGIVATGATLVGGGSVVLRPRFSASRFWDEIKTWQCTLFQYIGELCRFLTDSPPHPLETTHSLRLCCGNGLRPDIWGTFKQRFRIPRILEFYAATEGSFSLYNCEGEPGSIGRIPSFLQHRSPVALVRFDIETGMPIRGADGFCIRCIANEVGEAIGKIDGNGFGPGQQFEGYADAEVSERKILRGVFAEGDAWFRTGDLMRRDQRGYFYFIDRAGDSFRWKGENVSSQEVANTIAASPGVVEAVVYGVKVPGMDGRAGMAAIVTRPTFDLAILRRHLGEHLPDYARPLFLRLCSSVETTATFRPRKQDLARAGYDPCATVDPILFDDRTSEAFVKVDAALYERIQAKQLRL